MAFPHSTEIQFVRKKTRFFLSLKHLWIRIEKQEAAYLYICRFITIHWFFYPIIMHKQKCDKQKTIANSVVIIFFVCFYKISFPQHPEKCKNSIDETVNLLVVPELLFPRSGINFENQLSSQHGREVLNVLRTNRNFNIYISMTTGQPPSANGDRVM